MGIRVGDLNADLAPYVRIDQGVCAGCCPRDHPAIAEPLVGESPQTVVVSDGAGICRQGLVFGYGAGDGGYPDRSVVDVGDGGGLSAGHGLGSKVPVRVSDLNADLVPHIGIDQGVGAVGCPCDHPSVAEPLVGECAEPIVVTDCAGICRQGLVFGYGACDGRNPNRYVIDVGDGGGGDTGQVFHSAQVVGVVGRDRDDRTHVGLDCGISCGRCASNGHTIPVPLVGDGTCGSVGIGHVGSQGVALGGGGIVDAHRAGIVDVCCAVLPGEDTGLVGVFAGVGHNIIIRIHHGDGCHMLVAGRCLIDMEPTAERSCVGLEPLGKHGLVAGFTVRDGLIGHDEVAPIIHGDRWVAMIFVD